MTWGEWIRLASLVLLALNLGALVHIGVRQRQLSRTLSEVKKKQAERAAVIEELPLPALRLPILTPRIEELREKLRLARYLGTFIEVSAAEAELLIKAMEHHRALAVKP